MFNNLGDKLLSCFFWLIGILTALTVVAGFGFLLWIPWNIYQNAQHNDWLLHTSEGQKQDEANCTPNIVSTAPDGTKLWVISSACSKVARATYFSSKGTETVHSECQLVGKITQCHDVTDTVSGD